MQSTQLSSRQIKGLLKLGDTFVPGDEVLPSFSTSGCAKAVDRVLPFLPKKDAGDLKLLLWVLGFLPLFSISIFLFKLEFFSKLPGLAGALPRMMLFSLKGLVMTLYYSGVAETEDKNPVKLIGYEVGVSLQNTL